MQQTQQHQSSQGEGETARGSANKAEHRTLIAPAREHQRMPSRAAEGSSLVGRQ